MTRNVGPSKPKIPGSRASKPRPGHWLLEDAKARFSELVRKVRCEGPQHVTAHGRDEVVVIAAVEYRRLKRDLTGRALIDAIQSSPHREIELDPGRAPMPARGVALAAALTFPRPCRNRARRRS